MPFDPTPISFGGQPSSDSPPPAVLAEEMVSGEPLPVISFGPQRLPVLETVIDVRLGMSEGEAVTRAFSSPAKGRADMLRSEWGWEELRDYVVRHIEERWGASERDPVKEASIFRGFVGRWGGAAKEIAIAACEAHGCVWRSAPLTVNRFTTKSDPYFANVIFANLSVAA